MRFEPVLFAVVLLATVLPAAPPTGAAPAEGPLAPQIEQVARELADQALAGTAAYDFVRDLTVEVGPRPAGSDGDRRAVVWAEARLRQMGFPKVWTEPVTVPVWRRGVERGEILAPFPQSVVLTALGGSIATGPAGAPIEAEVVGVESLAELEALDRSRVEGKIVYVNGRMARLRDGSGYGPAVEKRGTGHQRAAEKGAVALLIRSVGTASDRAPHTGSVRSDDRLSAVPAAALADPDADILEAQLASGRPVRFRLSLDVGPAGEAQSANVLAEIPGAVAPDEIVLLVAHLDSWDLGQGAVDDGVGCAIVAEAARLILGRPERPRRTIRVVLSANEEHGLSGARAYIAAHEAEVERHVVGFEADFGAGRVWSFASMVGDEALPIAEALGKLLAPLGIESRGNTARGGADLRFLRQRGMPVFDLMQDATRYFDVHHSANDTMAQVEREAVDQNVAAYALAAWVSASVEGRFGWVVPPPESE